VSSTSHEDHLMLIGGELVPSLSGEWMESVNPATEDVLGRSPAADERDVARAVGAAADAAPAWARTPGKERADLLRELASRLREQRKPLAELEVADVGITIGIAEFDIDTAADGLDYYAGLVYEAKGETVPATPDHLHITYREPYGVVGRILPFNHPLMFAASKLAAPLAAGNTIVIKPSEQSPLSTLALGRLCQEIFPPGVVNTVTGLGGSAGTALVRDPRVRRLAFIGSVPTGLAIQRAAAESGVVKNITLELGGKNPLMVFPDADFDAAMAAAVRGMNFAWQGQSCGSTTRVFVHDDLYDAALDRLAELVGSIRVGDPMDRSVGMGPINSRGQLEKDLRYVDIAREEGARVLCGGGRPTGDGFERGYWLEPTVLCDVTPQMTVFREEIFGPVMSVVRWRDRDDLLSMANSVEYGLTASIWTQDVTEAMAVAREVEAGYVWINGVSSHFPGTSFGGVKNSGVGREEGLEELLSYTEARTLHVPTRRAT